MEENMEVTAVMDTPKFRDPPAEKEPLAGKWQKRIENAKRHYRKFHERIKHNRKLVAGFDWKGDPDSKAFYVHRANLIHATIAGILPALYAQNPEMSVSPVSGDPGLKLFCKTLEKVTNRYLEDARLKQQAKATVRSAA